MKTITERFISVAAIIAISPLLAMIALAIWLEDRKAPLYLQTRYGLNEKPFQLVKFRTMTAPAPGGKRKIEDHRQDSRATRVGRLLRATDFDELPQVLNIVHGDMSFVGPRPIPVTMAVKHIPNWQFRSTVRPGLTGLAQIHCTKYTGLREKFRFDALYVKRASLWLDFKLIMATVWRIRKVSGFVLWTVVILAATLLPIAESDIPGTGTFANIDKLAHFAMFAVMGFVAVWFATSFTGRFKGLCFGVTWGLLLAGGTEVAQSFVPLRNMSLYDFVADMAGVGCAVALVSIVKLKRGG